MAATQLPGDKYEVGGQPTIPGYEVIRWSASRDVRDEEITNGAGEFDGMLVYENRQLSYDFELLCLAAANPATAFPKGAMCTIAAYTNFFVEEAQVEAAEGVKRVTGRLVQVLSLA